MVWMLCILCNKLIFICSKRTDAKHPLASLFKVLVEFPHPHFRQTELQYWIEIGRPISWDFSLRYCAQKKPRTYVDEIDPTCKIQQSKICVVNYKQIKNYCVYVSTSTYVLLFEEVICLFVTLLSDRQNSLYFARGRFHQHFKCPFFVWKCFFEAFLKLQFGFVIFLSKENQRKSCSLNVDEIDYRGQFH